MKKGLLFCTVLIALLLGIVAPALAASPMEELAALAQYFPHDAPLYVSVRTDDAIITELDSVITRVLAKLPEGIAPPDFSLRNALDQIAREADVSDFSGIRAWLGDYAAAGMARKDEPSTAPAEGTLLAAQITDRAAAEAFWKAILDRSSGQSYTIETGDAYTLYAIETDPPTEGGLLFTDDVMLLGVANLEQLLLARDTRLAQNTTFTDTLALLPAERYSGLAYLNTPALAGESADAQMAADLLGPQAVGFSLLNERSLLVDIASKTGDLSVLQSQGITLPALQPVNPAFAARLPADASLLAHSSGLKAVVDAVIETARASDVQSGRTSEDFDKGLNQLKFAVRGFTGLDLDEDILSWMTGDFALFVSVDNAAIQLAFQRAVEGGPFVLETVPVEFGLVIEATDAAKATALAAGIGKALTQLTAEDKTVTLAQEQIGGVDVTVLSSQVEFSPGTKAPLDIVVGANSAVFVIATRDAATSILEGRPGIAGVSAFAEAAAATLPNAASVLYLDANGFGALSTVVGLALVGPAIGQVFENIVADLDSGAVSTLTPAEIQARQDEAQRQRQAELQQAQALMTFLNTFMTSATLSTSGVEGGAVTRFVLTLAE